MLAGIGGKKVRELLNVKSKAYKLARIDLENLSEIEVAEFLSSNPKALRRPLLTDGIRLVVGFVPEEIDEFCHLDRR